MPRLSDPPSSWFGTIPPPGGAVPAEDFAFVRLWRGFMTARFMIAAVLLLMQGSIYTLGQPVNHWLVGLCTAYLAATLAVRLLAEPRAPGRTFDTQWVFTIGVDLVAFSALQFLHGGNLTYTPLFALPVLLAAVMGSLLLALGTAASATLLLLVDAWLATLQMPNDTAARFLQAGLTGIGLFAVAVLAHQLAARLAREEQTARRSQRAARVQVQVNELVIEAMGDGVLVIDINGVVRAANPAARQLLNHGGVVRHPPFVLSAELAWQSLVALAQQTFVRQSAQIAEAAIGRPEQNPRRVHVRTRLTATQDVQAESLCVMFLQDLREMEARLRTEKLAAMGRMSAAVAHEIRNPLAAIAQANALLDEDLRDPGQRQLSLLVRQNAQRLAQIVDDVLDIARVQRQVPSATPVTLALDATVSAICGDWQRQAGCGERLSRQLSDAGLPAVFEPDHLRRVLINLLDNALRYASAAPGAIQVSTRATSDGLLSLRVWSDGAPLEPAVQQHLFEPFFSSESRSSGLGLYICRELCERHGALIGYQRTARERAGSAAEGNEFAVFFRPDPTRGGRTASAFDTILV